MEGMEAAGAERMLWRVRVRTPWRFRVHTLL